MNKKPNMETRLSWGLTGLEFITPFTAFVLAFIVNPGLSQLQSTLGTLNSSPLYFVAYFGLIIISIILFALSGKHFQILFSNKKISSRDKKLGVALVAVVLLLIAYLYFLPIFGILNSIQ